MRVEPQELRIRNYLQYADSKAICTVELVHNNHFDCRDEYGSFTPNGKYEPSPEIMYVHRLQNFFFEHGTELTV